MVGDEDFPSCSSPTLALGRRGLCMLFTGSKDWENFPYLSSWSSMLVITLPFMVLILGVVACLDPLSSFLEFSAVLALLLRNNCHSARSIFFTCFSIYVYRSLICWKFVNIGNIGVGNSGVVVRRKYTGQEAPSDNTIRSLVATFDEHGTPGDGLHVIHQRPKCARELV